MPGGGYLCKGPPAEPQAPSLSQSALADSTSRVLTLHSSAEGSSPSAVMPVGAGSWRLMPRFLWASPHEPFPIADFAVQLFAVINHNRQYDYMLSCLNLCIESPNLGSGLADLHHVSKLRNLASGTELRELVITTAQHL